MRIKRIAATGAAVVAGALVLSGCTQPYESDVVEGTEITVAYNSGFFSFNDDSSAGNNTANGNVKYITDTSFAYYDSEPKLVRNTDFGTFEKTSDDPLTVKYTITADAVWSDGVPITADDLLLSWAAGSGNVTSDPAFSPAATSGLNLVTSVPEIGDDNTSITLVYDEPYVDWELAFAVLSGFGVAAHGTYALAFPDEYADVQSAWDTYQDSGSDDDLTAYREAAEAFAEDAKPAVTEAIQDGDNGVLGPLATAWNETYNYTTLPESPAAALTSGAYVISDIVEDDYITLEANPLYTWGPSPKFEKITIRTIADSTAALQALENGDVDIWSGQPTADSLQIAEGLGNAEVEQRTQASYEHVDLTFNNGGPFDPATYGGDAAKALLVRQAFLLTIPREEILDKIIKPLQSDATLRNTANLVGPENPNYDEVAAENGSDFFATTDIEKAKSLLAEAGVTTPIDVKFWYPTGNVRRENELQLITASAALAGFNVVDTNEPDWLFTDPASEPVNPHDATIFAWSSTSLAVAGSDQIYKSYTDPNEKGGNYTGYANPTVDEALDALNVTTDPDEQLELQIAVEKQLYADAYGISIFQFPGLLVWSDQVTGVEDNPLSPNYFWNFWEWTPVED